MIIVIDTERGFDKIQYTFMINLGVRERDGERRDGDKKREGGRGERGEVLKGTYLNIINAI